MSQGVSYRYTEYNTSANIELQHVLRILKLKVPVLRATAKPRNIRDFQFLSRRRRVLLLLYASVVYASVIYRSWRNAVMVP